jgi:low affinity Fe/Cu permease
MIDQSYPQMNVVSQIGIMTAVTACCTIVSLLVRKAAKRLENAVDSIATKTWVEDIMEKNTAALMVRINEAVKEVAEQAKFNTVTEERLKRIEAIVGSKTV